MRAQPLCGEAREAGARFFMTVNAGSMPRGAAKLSAANLTKSRTWIDGGALNN